MTTINKSKSLLTLAFALFLSINLFAGIGGNVAENLKANAKIIGNETLGMEFYAENNERPIGVSIVKVYTNSIAHALGLQENDLLLGVENQPVFAKSIEQVFNTVKAGADVSIRIERNGSNEVLTAKMPALKSVSTEKAFLGVETFTASQKDALGIEIKKTLNNSTAEYVGLKKGDVILGIDNMPVVSNNLNSIIAKYHSGDKVIIRVQRNNEIIMIPAILGAANDNETESKNGPVTRL